MVNTACCQHAREPDADCNTLLLQRTRVVLHAVQQCGLLAEWCRLCNAACRSELRRSATGTVADLHSTLLKTASEQIVKACSAAERSHCSPHCFQSASFSQHFRAQALANNNDTLFYGGSFCVMPHGFKSCCNCSRAALEASSSRTFKASRIRQAGAES